MPIAGEAMSNAHGGGATRGRGGVKECRIPGPSRIAGAGCRCYTAELGPGTQQTGRRPRDRPGMGRQEGNTMKILRLLAIALAFAALNVHARGSVPIIDHEAVPAVRANGQPASAEQIRAALQAAGAQRGWQVTPAGSGKAVALLNVRGKHSISADVTFSAGKYAIKYRDSSNMNHEPGAGSGLIHPKYNMWVQTLIDDTRMQLARP
jgi:hypothetical protein